MPPVTARETASLVGAWEGKGRAVLCCAALCGAARTKMVARSLPFAIARIIVCATPCHGVGSPGGVLPLRWEMLANCYRVPGRFLCREEWDACLRAGWEVGG